MDKLIQYLRNELERLQADLARVNHDTSRSVLNHAIQNHLDRIAELEEINKRGDLEERWNVE